MKITSFSKGGVEGMQEPKMFRLFSVFAFLCWKLANELTKVNSLIWVGRFLLLILVQTFL